MILAISALFIGVALGMRHSVLILVPATIVSSAATVGLAVAHDDSLLALLLSMALTTVTLQMGYLAGSVVSQTHACQDSPSASVNPIEGAREGADVLYLHRYSLAKPR